ncbi:MAG: TIGR00282 family metallophosphoesterase [Treponemataceae bacterium]
MNVLYIAELVGKAGIQCVKKMLPSLKQEFKIDYVIANADGATNGAGLGKNHAAYLRKLGVDIITGGDFIFYKRDLTNDLAQMPSVLRPANYICESPGRGWRIIGKGEKKLAVVSLIGFSHFTRVHGENPFESLRYLVDKIKKETNNIIIDFHAGATAEKKSFSFFADGKVSAVIGSHGRVQTADECILDGGSATITDAGRTGFVHAVAGLDPLPKISEFLSGIPLWTKELEIEEKSEIELQGVCVSINQKGFADSIVRIKRSLKSD